MMLKGSRDEFALGKKVACFGKHISPIDDRIYCVLPGNIGQAIVFPGGAV
jgi:hypothetical protein